MRELLRAMRVPAVLLTVSHFFLMPYDALGTADTTPAAPPEDGSGA